MLAVSTAQRMQAVPELPTMAERASPAWSCSPGSPPWCRPPRRGRSSTRSTGGSTRSSPPRRRQKFLNSFGGDPFIATPEEGQALFRQGVKDWEGYVRAANIEPQ